MAELILNDNKLVRDYGDPYIIAELNTSHGGDLNTAFEMVSSAKSAGCDCVKFQSWSADTLYSNSYYDSNPIARRIVSKFALSDAELRDAAAFCREIGIGFASTPYSEPEVDLLLDCGVPFLKVASMELNNDILLRYIARTQMPTVLSTGMGELDEIHRAVSIFEDAGNKKLCILHCTSVYPTPAAEIRLLNLLGLREQFADYPIGFSDHSLGCEIAIASVGMGSAIIEKHFTLDSSVIGMDNSMACEPSEMVSLVRSCRTAANSLGGTERILSSAELEQRLKMRRSIVARRDLEVGHVINIDDLDAKRPGTGIPPNDIAKLIGRKVTSQIPDGSLIEYTSLELD